MKDEKNVMPEFEQAREVSRRKFLGYTGALAGAGLLISSCEKEKNEPTEPGAIDLGMNDEGLINLVFVSQQLEFDFYTQVKNNPYNNMHPYEAALFNEMYNQELAHREFLRNYLKDNGTEVTTDFSTVDFSNRVSTLENAILIENTVVAMLNEITRLLAFGDNTAVVAKMASLEARHAATVSNIRSEGNFFSTVDVTGSEPGTLPSNSIITFNKFLVTKVSGTNLPNK